MRPTTLAANGGGIVAELRDWARGCHTTEAAVELLIRAHNGRFVEPGQPWLRTDDRGIAWLDAEVIARYSDAVLSGERHILALVEALALGKPLEDVGGLMASLDPYHLDLVLAVLRHACCGKGLTRHFKRRRRRVLEMTGRSRSISMSHSDSTSRRASGCSPYRPESCKGQDPPAPGLSESTAARRARHSQRQRLGSDNTWIAF